MQHITKEFSAKGAMVSQVIPLLEILKMELDSNHSSEPDTTDKSRSILTTKDEMSSLDSQFNEIYSNYTYLLATLLDPRFKVNFFDTTTTQSAIDRLIKQPCESDSEVLPRE